VVCSVIPALIAFFHTYVRWLALGSVVHFLSAWKIVLCSACHEASSVTICVGFVGELVSFAGVFTGVVMDCDASDAVCICCAISY
jgi:hypothetical protein